MNGYDRLRMMLDDPAAHLAESERVMDRHNRKLAECAAKRLGLNESQQEAYYRAISAAPAVLKDGRPVPVHEIGMDAVEAL